MFTKEDFVIEFYNEFHLLVTNQKIKYFDELQIYYNQLFKKLLSKHKLKKLFPIIPKKSELYSIYMNLVVVKRLPDNYIMEAVFTSKIVRSNSGVLPISIALDGH